MVITQHRWPSDPRLAVRKDQRRRVNLKMTARIGCDIGSGARLRDLAAHSKQQPAALRRRSARRFVEQCCHCATCHHQVHAHLHSMGAGERIIEGVIASTGQRLDKALAEASGLSRERIKALMTEGRITLDGQPVNQPTLKPAGGAHFAITIPEATTALAEPQDIALTIVFEDAHLIIVDKPAGLVVHPAAGNLDGTLVNALLHHCRGQLSGIGGVARPGIVHRIDKDTSGLLVVAKSDAAHEGLAKQFADHTIERVYLAIVGGHPVPSSGTVSGAIGRSRFDRKKMAMVEAKGESGRGKHAVTHFKTLERLDNSALVECRLETGRTHQVRVHMASIGHALLGDPTYGRAPARLRSMLNELHFARQALHAAVLGFNHPVTGEPVRFESALPTDLRELLVELKSSS
jgi:23S rRNA pseudouridine1911/1915/1917 synthase